MLKNQTFCKYKNFRKRWVESNTTEKLLAFKFFYNFETFLQYRFYMNSLCFVAKAWTWNIKQNRNSKTIFDNVGLALMW